MEMVKNQTSSLLCKLSMDQIQLLLDIKASMLKVLLSSSRKKLPEMVKWLIQLKMLDILPFGVMLSWIPQLQLVVTVKVTMLEPVQTVLVLTSDN